MARPSVVVLIAVLAALPAAAQHHEHGGTPPERLGTVHFETSCAPAVQPAFDRAVALLHSFWFSAARDAFRGVLDKDPGCAIARWGMALTHYGNPFGGYRPPEAIAAGLEEADKGLAAPPGTPRERDYLAAVRTLFADAGTKSPRDRAIAYEQAMARLPQAWPADTEATIFYALALAQTAPPTDKTYANLKKAGALLEPIFAKQPDHPGLAHYIIHAYDVPPLAPKALEAARRYAQIAPSAPHALHMPSHTFTRVGLWDESVATNIESAQAARRDKSVTDELHAMDYLVYAYLQTARDQAAHGVVGTLQDILEGMSKASNYTAAPVPAGYFAAAAIPVRYALERGAWAEAAALTVQPSQFAHVPAITHFARALGAARAGRIADARADIARLAELQSDLTAKGDAYWAEQVDIQRQVASAWVAHAQGNAAEAERQLRTAADREDATEKSAVTPGPFVPARESLGELLLLVNRPAEALEAFERNLTKEPNRLKSVFGAARAADLAGDRGKARTYYTQVTELCAQADTPDRAELRAARAYLADSAGH